MNVSQFLAEVGDVLDDPNGSKYPLAARVRHGDRSLRGLFRSMVDGNKQWSNFTMCVQKEVALEPLDNVFDYRLPSWIMAVVRVWPRSSTSAVETSLSPYLWTSGTVQVGEEIPRSGQRTNHRWSWEGSGTLRLHNYGEAQELVLAVAARPPRMFYGRLSTDSSAQNKLYLPDPNYGTVELEEGAYINSDWQITETATANATRYGDIRRCVYSNAATIAGGVRYHELTMDANWTSTPVTGDVIQTVLPLPDEHCRVLVLKTAQACLQQKGNIKGLQAISSELVEETSKFMRYATAPRDQRGPVEWKRRNDRPRSMFYTGTSWVPWN